jgi:hypothetical protein
VLDMLPDLDHRRTHDRARRWRRLARRPHAPQHGTLPTKSAIGVKSRRLPGIVCVLDPDQHLDTTRIVSGPRAIRFASIEGTRRTTERAEWLIIAEQGDTVDLEVRSPLIGTTRFELTMEGE